MIDKVAKKAFTIPMAKFERSAKIGWWETIYQANAIMVSDYLVHLFDLDSHIVTPTTFRKCIASECLRGFLFELTQAKKDNLFKHTFQAHSRYGKIWVRVECSGRENNENGESVLYGYVQQVDAPETIEEEKLNSSKTAIEKSEEILRNLYDNFPIGIELYDRNGILVDINNKDVAMFGGQKKEDILGINIFDHPILLPEIKERVRREEPVNFTSSFDCSLLPGYYESQKHEVFDLTTKVTYLYDSKGELTHYVFTNVDEEETVNAYKRIQEFESHFAMISDYAKVGYCKWNPLTKEGFAIGQWFKNLERPVVNDLKDMIGQYANVHPDDLADITEFYSDAVTGKQNCFSKEIRVFKKDGEISWLRSYQMVKIYKPESNCIEIMGMNFDITQLKKIESKLTIAKEKAEIADKLKSSFLANMSHEIRTPLNAIVGFSDVLIELKNANEAEKREYMDLIKENSDLLLKLINDIIDLSKIEAGKYDFVSEDIDIYLLCQHAVESLNLIPKKGVTMLCRDGLRPFVLRTDKNRLLQVINNLLHNAMKFTDEGYIELSYEIQEKYVRFQVKDTGCGIPADQCSRIFERFEKLNSFVQGAGLGLSICKQIIDKLNGSIGVESDYGKGATFWFTVPY